MCALPPRIKACHRPWPRFPANQSGKHSCAVYEIQLVNRQNSDWPGAVLKKTTPEEHRGAAICCKRRSNSDTTPVPKLPSPSPAVRMPAGLPRHRKSECLYQTRGNGDGKLNSLHFAHNSTNTRDDSLVQRSRSWAPRPWRRLWQNTTGRRTSRMLSMPS